MKQFLKIFITLFFTGFLHSCSNYELKFEDFVGLWKSSDGSELEIFEDNTFIAKNINYHNYYDFDEYKNLIISFKGKCQINNTENSKKELKFYGDSTFEEIGIPNITYMEDGVVKSHNITFSLEISGQGNFGNTPPWDLYVWIGDPDSMNKYLFKKVSNTAN